MRCRWTQTSDVRVGSVPILNQKLFQLCGRSEASTLNWHPAKRSPMIPCYGILRHIQPKPVFGRRIIRKVKTVNSDSGVRPSQAL